MSQSLKSAYLLASARADGMGLGGFKIAFSIAGSPDGLQLSSPNHLREGSGSAGFTVTSGRKNGANGHMSQYWREHDSGSSSLSNSRDVFSHINPHLE